MPTKHQVEGLIERLGGEDYHLCEPDCMDIECKQYITTTDNPITIGTVLEKMKECKFESYCALCDADANFITLVNLWGVCGFSRSLQEIIEESGYIQDCPRCGSIETPLGKMVCGGEVEILKSPEASALFEFLLHLFPINNE